MLIRQRRRRLPRRRWFGVQIGAEVGVPAVPERAPGPWRVGVVVRRLVDDLTGAVGRGADDCAADVDADRCRFAQLLELGAISAGRDPVRRVLDAGPGSLVVLAGHLESPEA